MCRNVSFMCVGNKLAELKTFPYILNSKKRGNPEFEPKHQRVHD